MQAALQHIYKHHQNGDGWVTLAKKDKGVYKQYHYKIDELQDKLTEWIGEDVYFSQNTFYRPQRRIENLRQLRSLYCDIDFYKTGLTVNQVMMALELDYFRQTIPEPNYIIYSGRGIVLVWLIEPVPIMALPRWQAVENFIVNQLKPFGADTQASDAARIFRLAGTINSKNKKTVTVEYRHDFRYDLEQLKLDYLPEIKKEKRQKEQKPKTQKKIESIFNIYTLHFNRLRDLCKIIELRNHHMTGYRELTLFLYRYWSCCFLSDKEEALNQTLSLNAEFTEPLKEREVERATKSAERAYDQWLLNVSNGTYKRGGYNFTNQKIISMLDITDDEQKHLKTIINKDEKQRRNTIAKRNNRREKGTMERKRYIECQKDITYQKLQALRKLIAENPYLKNKELAEMLSVSPARVSQLKKML